MNVCSRQPNGGLSFFGVLLFALMLSVQALAHPIANSFPTVRPRSAPSAVFDSVGAVCSGQSTTLRITLQGQGPWSFDLLANDSLLSTVAASDSVVTFAVTLQQNTVFSLQNLFDQTGTGTGDSILIEVLPAPAAVLEPDTVTHCIGLPDTLRIHLSGPGPYTFVPAVNGVPLPAVTTNDTLYLLPVTATLPDTSVFTLDSVGGGGCPGQTSGAFAVVTIPVPEIANLKLNCAQVQGPSGTYRVEFDIVGGTPPYTLVTGFGTFTGDHFRSTNIPAAQGYTFVFHDANNCDSVTVTGYNTCFCTTRAGSFVPVDSLTGCIGTPVYVEHNGDQVLDSDDAFMFILHTEPGLTVGTIIDTNHTEARFEFNFATMGIHVNYWISAIAGNSDGAGGVDLNDPCFSMTPGLPVHWHLLPTVTLDTLADICPGEPVSIPVELTGSVPRTFTYSTNGVEKTIATPLDLIYLTDTLFETTTFIPISIHDLDCPNTSSDTALVRVHPTPAIAGLQTICSPGSSTYRLSFDVTNADLATVVISGTVNGSYDPASGRFLSDPIPKTDTFTVMVRDTFGCGADTVSGMAQCTCATFSGTMQSDTLEACAGQTIGATFNSDAVLAPGDTLVFLLHTSPGSLPGMVLAINDEPVFDYLPGMTQPESLYYISAVAGTPDSSGLPDLNAPCLSASSGTPVRWHALPSAVLDTVADACAGEPISLAVQCSGVAPFLFSYTLNGQISALTGSQPVFTLDTILEQSAVFQSVGIQDAFCAAAATGQAVVSIHAAPEVANLAILCHPDNLYYSLDFDVVGEDLPGVVITGSSGGNYDPQTGHFSSAPIPVQNAYSFTISDGWQCGQQTVSGIAACSCTTSAGSLDPTAQILCYGDSVKVNPAAGAILDANDTLLYALVTAPLPANWTILATSAWPGFAFDPAYFSPGTPYYVVVLAGNAKAGNLDPDDPCLSVALGPMVIWRAQPEAALAPADVPLCLGDSAVLTLTFQGGGPYSFQISENGIPGQWQTAAGDTFSFRVAPGATTTYSPQNLTAYGCPGAVSGGSTVTVLPLPVLSSNTVLCDLASQTYTVSIGLDPSSGPAGSLSIQGLAGNWSGLTFTSAPVPSGQPYAASLFSANGCSVSISGNPACSCTTAAGTLTPGGPLSVCLPGTAIVPSVTNAVLDNDDGLQYILFSEENNPLNSLIAQSTLPEFGFLAGMQTGQPYYIAALAGNAGSNGAVDWNDPCLSVSPAVTVIFHAPPQATLNGAATVCPGGNAAFQILFSGTPPYNFQYAINGIAQASLTAPQNNFSIATNNVTQPQTFTLVSVQDAYCPGSVSGSATVQVTQPPAGILQNDTSICHGSAAVLQLQLSGGTDYSVTITGGPQPIQLAGVQNGDTVSVWPAGTTTYTLSALSASGNSCTATTGSSATVTVLPAITAPATLSDYGGVQVSCPGAADGTLDLMPAGGLPPYTAVWNTGVSGLSLSDIPAGNYAVTLTDQAGCTAQAAFVLSEPSELVVFTRIEPPTCADRNDGVVYLDKIEGGAWPYAYAWENATGQPIYNWPVVIDQLAAGDYQLVVSDANGCDLSVALQLPAPPALSVLLGMDTTLNLGDSVWLAGQVSTPALDSIAWTPVTGLSTPTGLSTWAAPQQSTVFALWVRDTNGCTASDQIAVTVIREHRVFLPNVLKPEAAGGNGAFTVFAGPEVQRITRLRIYNRWGECLFEGVDLSPNDPSYGWQGTFRGEPVEAGVYLYHLELQFSDGEKDVRSGTVTVVR